MENGCLYRPKFNVHRCDINLFTWMQTQNSIPTWRGANDFANHNILEETKLLGKFDNLWNRFSILLSHIYCWWTSKYINRCFVCKLHTSIRDSVRHLESTVIPLIFRNVKDSLFLLELCDLIVPDIILERNN